MKRVEEPVNVITVEWRDTSREHVPIARKMLLKKRKLEWSQPPVMDR